MRITTASTWQWNSTPTQILTAILIMALVTACDRHGEQEPAEELHEDEKTFALELPDALRGESFRALDRDISSTAIIRDSRRFAHCDACDVAIVHSRGPSPRGIYINDLELSSDATNIRATDEELFVDDRWVVSISDGTFSEAHLQALVLRPLLDQLEDTRRQRRAEAELLDMPFEPTAVLFLDPALPWRSTLIVIHTTMQSGFQVGLAVRRPNDITELELACLQRRDEGGPLYAEGHAQNHLLGTRPAIHLCRPANAATPETYQPVSIALWQVGALQEVAGPHRASANLLATVDADSITLTSETADDRTELATDELADSVDVWLDEHPDGRLTFSATATRPTGDIQALLDTLLFDGDTPRFPYVSLALHQ